MKSHFGQCIRSFFTLVLLFTFVLPSQAHYAKVTKFNMNEHHDGFDINVKIDLSDVLYTLQSECEDFETADADLYHQMIEDYIYDCFIIKSDHQVMEFHIDRLSVDDHYIHLHGEFPAITTSKTLEVYSSCMVNTISNQSNIISVTRKGSKRSFRLHRSRMKTKIMF